jgi:uncharacterized protein
MDYGVDNPLIRALDRAGIEAILARNHVGRIGYIERERVELRPVHYVFDDGWIYGRTSPGTSLEALGKAGKYGTDVVFEVDEVEGMFRWRSVLVHGGFYVLDRDDEEFGYETWMKALGLLRTLLPETMRSSDPVPAREVLFRISMEVASGREATDAGGV